MGEKIIVGPIGGGLQTNKIPAYINNDSFPVLNNAYQWRDRVKRKRGTSLLTRLNRYFDSNSTSYNSGSTTITLDGSGNGNLITGWSLESESMILPGSVTITDTISAAVYTDPSEDGTLSPSGSINYATGAVTIAASAGNTVRASFRYYPLLPVLGLKDFIRSSTAYPGSIGFDSKYAYNILTTSPNNSYDVSFYKNPVTGTYAGYTEKTNVTRLNWANNSYQQFQTVNYQGALFATPAVSVPFTTTNVGMQFKTITNIAIVAVGPAASATLTIAGHGLSIGDFLFINEVQTGVVTGINFQTCYVTAVPTANTVTVVLPNATLGGAGGAVSTGIAQYLTNTSDSTKACLRWYDGDPTDGNASSPTLNGHLGWVNFCPPLSNADFSIDDTLADQYYLVGAKTIAVFKDRLFFLGPVIQTSTANSQIYLQDAAIYSEVGTPYYTASFTGDVTSAATTFNAVLVPSRRVANPNSFVEDLNGFGGSIVAGTEEAITGAGSNQDVLLTGFTASQKKIVYTGNDLIPFAFYTINSELGTSSTSSVINMDKGIISRGSRGYIITSQVESQRIDLAIPDSVYEINLQSNGTERFTAARDFINEWIFFTYNSNQVKSTFPNKTLLYNYRDNSWGSFDESFTTYGSFRINTGYTWATIGTKYPTWSVWNVPWKNGSSNALTPRVIGGNQHGFVLLRQDNTGEAPSLAISDISTNTITCYDHGLATGDYIIIKNAIGTVSSQVNDKIFSVNVSDLDTFTLNPPITSATYLGLGTITRMYVPFIQSKQFPTSWGYTRKTRIGVQQYLFTKTNKGQVTLYLYLNQDSSTAFNDTNVYPSANVVNHSIVYSAIVYTCPESTNLGLTPANINLQMPTSNLTQDRIWHRVNNSLIGDTVQVGITLSDAQMRDTNLNSQFAEIELHGFILDVSPSQLLA